jgi:hypothetical protein
VIDPKILSYTPTVKEKFGFRNSLSFQTQIDDFRLKCCILGEKPKNNISGSTPHSRKLANVRYCLSLNLHHGMRTISAFLGNGKKPEPLREGGLSGDQP